MGTIIDEFVTRVRIDAKGFRADKDQAIKDSKSLRDAVESDTKDIEDVEDKATVKRAKSTKLKLEENSKLGDSFAMVAKQALGMAAILVGANGIKDYVSQTVTGLSQVDRAARAAGLSVNELSAFGSVIERNGGNAETARASITNLAKAMQVWRTTGEVGRDTLIGASYTGIGSGDTAIDAYQKFADWAGKQKDKQLVNQVGGYLGLDEGSIDQAMRGVQEFNRTFEETKRLAPTAEDTAKVRELQMAWKETRQEADKLARDMLEELAPSLVTAAEGTTAFLKAIKPLIDLVFKQDHGKKYTEDQKATVNALAKGDYAGAYGATVKGAVHWWEDLINKAPAAWDKAKQAFTGSMASKPATGAGAFGSDFEKENFIRSEAVKRGIDPDIAVRVAKSEGFNTYTGDRGSSFGAFQLHYGGVAKGGMAVSGLGDEFTRKTGLHASDPSTERQQIQFALDQAKKGGWGPWHGWKGARDAGIGGGGQTVTIGTINLQTQATDARGIAKDFRSAMRNPLVPQINTGVN